jgi:hypothetical protein
VFRSSRDKYYHRFFDNVTFDTTLLSSVIHAVYDPNCRANTRTFTVSSARSIYATNFEANTVANK